LICVFNESISPLAATGMNLVKSPSIAAAAICSNPHTQYVFEDRYKLVEGNLRDLLPDPLNIPNLGLNS
jgi:hypothetical protein